MSVYRAMLALDAFRARSRFRRCMPLWAAIIVVAGVSSNAFAQEAETGVYECIENGVPSFSEEPCEGDERHVEIGYEQPSAGQVEAAEQRASNQEATSDLYADRIALKRDIARSEGRISDLRKQRESELAQLKASLNDDDAKLTQSIWNQGVSERMEAVTSRYDSDIAEEQRRLQDLLSRDRAMGSKLP